MKNWTGAWAGKLDRINSPNFLAKKLDRKIGRPSFRPNSSKLAGRGARPIFRKSADFGAEARCHCRPMSSKRPPPDEESMRHRCKVHTSLHEARSAERHRLRLRNQPDPERNQSNFFASSPAACSENLRQCRSRVEPSRNRLICRGRVALVCFIVYAF